MNSDHSKDQPLVSVKFCCAVLYWCLVAGVGETFTSAVKGFHFPVGPEEEMTRASVA